MALIVEDGSAVAGAESFITVAAATTHHANLGNTAWAALSEAEQEQALRRATRYMEQGFRSRWKGYRVSELQVLSWPRSNVIVDRFTVASSVVPTVVQEVCADMALKASAGDLVPDIAPGVVREKVDVLEVEYDPKMTAGGIYYKAAEQALAPFLSSGSSPTFSTVAVVRT